MPKAASADTQPHVYPRVVGNRLNQHRQLLDRASTKLDEAISQNRGGRITVFSHTGTICILALHLMGALDAPELKPIWIASSNCGITRFELRDDGFVRVLTV